MEGCFALSSEVKWARPFPSHSCDVLRSPCITPAQDGACSDNFSEDGSSFELFHLWLRTAADHSNNFSSRLISGFEKNSN